MKAWKNKTAWKLYKDNWRLCHEIVDLRDGRVCQIPGCGETQSLQLDHVFSRQCKTLFFDPKNLGYLCGPHHTHKSFRRGQWVEMTVKDICKTREGEGWWDYALFTSKRNCGKFKTVLYQEEINLKLKEELALLLEEKGGYEQALEKRI